MSGKTKKQDIKKAMTQIAQLIADAIDGMLPPNKDALEDRLLDAMRYSAVYGGKKIRPFLVMTAGALFRVPPERSLRVACAVEMIHSYSLIHDDLPALDNSTIRRGKKSCHIEFDEATAILAGDGLLTYAFELISDPKTERDPSIRIALVQALARAAGYNGMVGGQIIDLTLNNEDISFAELIRLQRMKTGAMFTASCESGAILGRASPHLLAAIRSYANSLGIAFQIVDDLKDMETDQSNKPSLVSHLGVEKASEHAIFLSEQAIDALKIFGESANLLKELARFIVSDLKS